MAVLKKITFGSSTTPIAKTVVTAASESVLTVGAAGGKTNGVDEDADYGYEIDLTLSGDGTLTKDNGALKVGTVPAAQVSVADDGGKLTATNVEAALAELDDKITSTGNVAKKYKVVPVDSPANTSLAEYKLQVAEGTSTTYADVDGSATIVVPKDQHLKSVELVTQDDQQHTGQFLKYTYVLNTGAENVVYVDVSSFLTQSEFGDGLTVSNAGVVSVNAGNGLGINQTSKAVEVVVDSTSEKDSQSTPADFLTVGANGVKIQGIKDEIDRKINALDVTTDAAVAGQYVAAIQEADGIVSVKTRANVSEAVLNNYAKGSAPAAGSEAVAATDTVNQAIAKLEHQVDAAKSATTSAIQALDHTDNAVDGQVVTAVSTADGIATPAKADLAGVKLGGFTQDANATGAIADTDTLGAALNKLENGIDAVKQAAEAGHSAVAKDANASHLTLSEATDTTTGKKTYTIGENDIASDTDLDAEVTRAQTAEGAIDTAVGLTKASGSETRSISPTTNYGGNATTVMGNMQNLDTQIKANADAITSLQNDVAAITYEINGTNLILRGIDAYVAPQP